MNCKKTPIFDKVLSRVSLGLLVLAFVLTFFQYARQLIFYSQMVPFIDEVEIGALLLFVTNFNFLFVELILCSGFLLIYLSIKAKKEEKK